MKTIESIANSLPSNKAVSSLSIKSLFKRKQKPIELKLDADSTEYQPSAKSAVLRLAAVSSAVLAGVYSYEALRSFDWFASIEAGIGIAPAVPALLAATKLINGFDCWRINRADVIGLTLSAPLAALWLSHYGAGGVHGYELMQELKNALGGSYTAAMFAAITASFLAASPFVGNIVKLSDMLGNVFAAMYKPSNKAPVVTISMPLIDAVKQPTIEPVATGEQQAVLRQWLDDNDLQGVEIVDFKHGNSVDTFELSLPAGVRAKAIIEGAQDISRAFSGLQVRVVPVIKGKKTIAIEIARVKREFVQWRDVVSSKEFKGVLASGGLPVIVGQDKTGANLVYDLRDMYHLLIAGRTGAGKSVGLNSLIMGLAQLPPKQLKITMIDPKLVELAPYAKLPHMITKPLTNLTDAVLLLNKMCLHMESRYTALQKAGVRNIAEYNEIMQQQGLDTLPYVVIIVDEFADLVLEDSANRKKQDDDSPEYGFKEAIQKLAQKARAAGIHLVLTTQRPDAKVFDGLIKANIPSRICYQVADGINSRIVLDETGAESLLDKGDCLVKTPTAQELVRCQGANISTKEVNDMVKQLAGGK